MNKFGCVSFKPGDAGFNERVAQCTPLSKIKSPFPKCIPTPHGEMQQGIGGRRYESVHEIRGGK